MNCYNMCTFFQWGFITHHSSSALSKQLQFAGQCHSQVMSLNPIASESVHVVWDVGIIVQEVLKATVCTMKVSKAGSIEFQGTPNNSLHLFCHFHTHYNLDCYLCFIKLIWNFVTLKKNLVKLCKESCEVLYVLLRFFHLIWLPVGHTASIIALGPKQKAFLEDRSERTEAWAIYPSKILSLIDPLKQVIGYQLSWSPYLRWPEILKS